MCCKLLLEKGHVTECVDDEGVTPLLSSISSGAIDSFKILLEYGADISHVNKEG